MLKNKSILLLTAIINNPGVINVATLAKLADISRTVTYYHLQRLEDEGAIIIEREGKHIKSISVRLAAPLDFIVK